MHERKRNSKRNGRSQRGANHANNKQQLQQKCKITLGNI